MDRQRAFATTDGNRAKLVEELKQIEWLEADINNSPGYHVLKKGAQKALLKGDWRTGRSWQELAGSVGLNEKYFRNAYNYLCGYSHASYAAALQVGQAQGVEDQQELASGMLGVLNLCIAHFAVRYCRLFPQAQAILEAHPGGALARWNIGPESFDRHYRGA